MKEVFAAYVWSQNWWTFSNDMWNGQSHTYENSQIVTADALDWNLVSSGEAYHASLYFERDKEDAHQFTPTSIWVDNVDNPSRIEVRGTETFTGDDIREADDWIFEVGNVETYEAGNMDVEFEVTQIVVAKTEEEKEDIIVSFIERQSEIDQEELDSMSAETFNARKKLTKDQERKMRQSNRRSNKNNPISQSFMKKKKPTDQQLRYSENFTTSKYAESFRSESASDAIAAESSQPVSGLNPTSVGDGQWLAESISKRAEAKHSYPHRTIDGDNYVHHDGKGRETRRTNRGKSIKADRRRYTPNNKLKPGQGHLGDFVREAQGAEKWCVLYGQKNPRRHDGCTGRATTKNIYGSPMCQNCFVYSYDSENRKNQKRRLRAERSLQTRRAESPLTSPESYSPTGSSPTDMNPKSAGPSSAGTGNEVIAVQSPSAPPSNIKFAETICAKHAETYEACGCEKKMAEPSGSNLTNASTSSSDPLNESKLSGFDIVNVDSPSAPPSNIFEQSAEECSCDIGAVGVCRCAETKAAEMNYDGSLYGDQYFPDTLTANQVGVGNLGSTPSADTSGQGVLEWDGGRVGPNPDTKAAEVLTRRNLGFVGAISLIAFGGYFLGLHDKVLEFIKKE
jgi:hypothetical protein